MEIFEEFYNTLHSLKEDEDDSIFTFKELSILRFIPFTICIFEKREKGKDEMIMEFDELWSNSKNKLLITDEFRNKMLEDVYKTFYINKKEKNSINGTFFDLEGKNFQANLMPILIKKTDGKIALSILVIYQKKDSKTIRKEFLGEFSRDQLSLFDLNGQVLSNSNSLEDREKENLSDHFEDGVILKNIKVI